MLASPFPVLLELMLVACCPLNHHTKRSTRQGSFEDMNGLYGHNGLVLRINRVKMRRFMIIVEHGDDNPIKLSDPRHVLDLALRRHGHGLGGQHLGHHLLRGDVPQARLRRQHQAVGHGRLG